MQKSINQKIKEVMSFMGKQGTGIRKVRGDSTYYQGLVRAREAKRKANKGASSELPTKASTKERP